MSALPATAVGQILLTMAKLAKYGTFYSPYEQYNVPLKIRNSLLLFRYPTIAYLFRPNCICPISDINGTCKLLLAQRDKKVSLHKNYRTI